MSQEVSRYYCLTLLLSITNVLKGMTEGFFFFLLKIILSLIWQILRLWFGLLSVEMDHSCCTIFILTGETIKILTMWHPLASVPNKHLFLFHSCHPCCTVVFLWDFLPELPTVWRSVRFLRGRCVEWGETGKQTGKDASWNVSIVNKPNPLIVCWKRL